MSAIFYAAIRIAVASAALMALASWWSPQYLSAIAVVIRRLHDWVQLRIKARIAGLGAYRSKVAEVLKGVS